MLKITTPINYDINLKDDYRIEFEKTNDSLSLHKYLLCLLTDDEKLHSKSYEDIFSQINDLLPIAIEDKNVQNYEVLFYYELCRANANDALANSLIERHPEYIEYCKLNCLGYFFLKEIRLLDAAEDYLNELYNVLSISYEMFCVERVDIYRLRNKLSNGYEILKNEIIDATYYAPSVIFSLLTDLAIELNLKDDLLDFYHNAIKRSPHVKWISLGFIKLCQDMDLLAEAEAEYLRLKDVVSFVYKEDGVNKKNSNLFLFFCESRKMMGFIDSKNDAAKELDISITENFDSEFLVTNNYETDYSSKSKIWINDIFKAGNKSFLKRETKMNKALKTHFKVFANQEKEMIFSKSIFANIISLINHRFTLLFGEGHFVVSDYDLFFESFPFYDLNGFTEDEIDDVCSLLSKIFCSSTQLNPYVSSHTFNGCQMLIELLSINTTIETESKTFEFKAYDESSGQITVFGTIAFLTTFLTKAEKTYFANDLAGSDYMFSSALMKQVFDTFPNASINVFDENRISLELYREKVNSSLILRKELFRFLLEFEAKVLRKHNILDETRPSYGALSFPNMLKLEFDSESVIYKNISNIHYAACLGVDIEENYNDDNSLSIQNIVNNIEECIDNNEFDDLFQEELECLFNIFVNRKYYNYLKWSSGKYTGGFLTNYDTYCRKMLYRNEHLMTEDDEYLLYDCTKERIMSYLDDTQRNEIYGILGSKSFKWEKITITILDVPETKCHVILNGEFVIRSDTDRYIQIKNSDEVKIDVNDNFKFVGYEDQEIFDSPIAKFIIKKAIIEEI